MHLPPVATSAPACAQGGVVLDITNRNALGKPFNAMDKRFGKKELPRPASSHT
jgi:hypothetical protein